MSALARYFNANGSLISGSDKSYSPLTDELNREGINDIWSPHNEENIEKIDPDIVAYSTAINSENDEYSWSKKNNKIMLHRSELLEIATSTKKLISITGTHGKTTTSAMVAEMLFNSKLDISAILGGILLSKNSNSIIGKGEYFVIEGDESDKSFLKGNPSIGVITNIEPDHLENYPGGVDEIKECFKKFANKCLNNEGLIACFDDKLTKEILQDQISNEHLIRYGFDESSCNLVAKETQISNSWDIYYNDNKILNINLSTHGKHNVLNSLAAIGVSLLLKSDYELTKQSLEAYKGVKRRFQYIEQSPELTIVDDYAHHPTEITATVNAANEIAKNRLVVVLQPHHPLRLRDLWNDFISSLSEIKHTVFVTDTYVARGNEIEGINSRKLVEEISKPNINYLPGDIDNINEELLKMLKPNDFVLIMGAGNITELGPKLLSSYKTLAMNSGNN